jgi:hypothetical protein
VDSEEARRLFAENRTGIQSKIEKLKVQVAERREQIARLEAD